MGRAVGPLCILEPRGVRLWTERPRTWSPASLCASRSSLDADVARADMATRCAIAVIPHVDRGTPRQLR